MCNIGLFFVCTILLSFSILHLIVVLGAIFPSVYCWYNVRMVKCSYWIGNSQNCCLILEEGNSETAVKISKKVELKIYGYFQNT